MGYGASVDFALYLHVHYSYSTISPGVNSCTMRLPERSLKKIVGHHKLAFEEFATVLIDCEALLNSHPLVPYQALEPDGVAPLTAGYFLIGACFAFQETSGHQESQTMELDSTFIS